MTRPAEVLGLTHEDLGQESVQASLAKYRRPIKPHLGAVVYGKAFVFQVVSLLSTVPNGC